MGDGRALALERHLDADVLVAVEGEQMVDDGEVARRLARRGASRSRSSMAREVVEHPVGPARLVLR